MNSAEYSNQMLVVLLIGLSVGFGLALKNVVDSFVYNTLEPMILLLFPKNKYNNLLQFVRLISNITSFIIIILIILYTLKNY